MEITITFRNTPCIGDVTTITGLYAYEVVQAINYLEEQGILKTPKPQVKEDK